MKDCPHPSSPPGRSPATGGFDSWCPSPEYPRKATDPGRRHFSTCSFVPRPPLFGSGRRSSVGTPNEPDLRRGPEDRPKGEVNLTD